MMNAIVAKFSVHIWRLGSFRATKNKNECCSLIKAITNRKEREKLLYNAQENLNPLRIRIRNKTIKYNHPH